jgi:adenylate kinase family enzyme
MDAAAVVCRAGSSFLKAGTSWHPVGVLIALAGLPGSGKSAVAEDLSRALRCAVLSVDPAEAAMWRAGISKSEPTGLAAYMVVGALAAEQDNLEAALKYLGRLADDGQRSV